MKRYLAFLFALSLLAAPFAAYAVSPYTPFQGGTGTSTIPVYGQVLVGNSGGTYTLTATSSLGITGGGGGGGTVNSGTTGQFPYYAANGTTLTATSSLFLDTTNNIGFSTAAPKYPLHIQKLRDGWAYAGIFLSPASSTDYSRFNYVGGNGAMGLELQGTSYLGTNPTAVIDVTASSTINFLTGNGTVAPATLASFTSATSTFSSTGGINLTAGCFAIAGSCISGGAGGGTVTSIGTTYPVTGGPFTTSGTIALAFGTTTANSWSALQSFANASSTLQTATTLWDTGLTANQIVTTNANDQLVSSSTIGNNQLQNASLTVTASSGLSGGGSVALGGSTSLSLNLANANNWTGLQTFQNASSTFFSNFNTAYFGGTATSTINSAGLFTGNASTTNFTATNAWFPSLTASSLLALDQNRMVISSSTIGNNQLQNSTVTVTAGSGLSGGGTVPLGGSTSLSLNLANANNWTGLQTFVNASSTNHSNFGTAYFGGTATTTIDSAGNIVIPSGSTLTNTGLTNGCATWASGVLGTTGVACGSGGSSQWTTNGSSIYYNTGNIGVGTTTPFGLLTVATPNSSTGATANLFLIASSTPTATTTLFSVSNNGILNLSIDPSTSTLMTFGLNSPNNATASSTTFLIASSGVGVLGFGPGALSFFNATSTTFNLFGDTAFGQNALRNATTTNYRNTAFGYAAMQGSASATFNGFQNTAMGNNAMAAMTTASNNVAIGYFAAAKLTGGQSNVVIGANAGASITGGTSDTFVGQGSAQSVSNGVNDSFFGNSSGTFNSGSGNTALGAGALSGTGANGNNTVVGLNAGNSLTTGSSNVFIGDSSVTNGLATGNGNIGIGENIFFPTASTNRLLNIGNFLFGLIPATTTAFQIPGTTATSTYALGLGTTTPDAEFSISANSGSVFTTNHIFEIASSTASATTTLFAVSNSGHIIASSTNPTLSSCGTSPTIVGDDAHGEITVGGTASGCTMTFQIPYTVAPVCTVSNQSMSVVNPMTYTISATTLTISQTGLSGNKVDYICEGFNGI